MKGEEEGVDTMQGINKVLLENLLPAHVARHFLTNIKVHIFVLLVILLIVLSFMYLCREEVQMSFTPRSMTTFA